MKLTYGSCGLLLAVAVSLVRSNPIAKREAEKDLSPLNETNDLVNDVVDDNRSDRDKRKIGLIELGVTNGIINFVFGKLDSFLDAKTRALSVLDESNKAKNEAFGIDNTQSATGQFLSNVIAQKIQASTASIGPIINSATTLLSGAKSGIAGAFASKLAPLSSLSAGAGAGGSSGGSGVGALGGILSSKVGILSNLSGTSNLSGDGSRDVSASTGSGASANAGINLGALTSLGGGMTIQTTTEDIPEFDRTRVSLDIPPPIFGNGFTLITNISKIMSSLILNSARRTQSILEVLKPFFRGVFAIKGLPSDNSE